MTNVKKTSEIDLHLLAKIGFSFCLKDAQRVEIILERVNFTKNS